MSDFHAYFVVRDGNKKIKSRFAYGQKSFVEKLAKSWASPDSVADDIEPEEESTTPDFNHESALSASLAQSVDFALINHQLITVSSTAPAVFSYSVRELGIIEPISKDAVRISSDNGVDVYGLTEDQYLNLVDQKDIYEQTRAGTGALPAATLLSFVATFDTLIVDILGKLIRIDPERMIRSDQAVSAKAILESTSREDIISLLISEELYVFSRGSHEEQERFIASTFHVSIKEKWKRWPDYIEVFERRNLIAHGEKTFNRRYVDICKRNNHKGSEELLGKDVDLTTPYLRQALDVLVEFAILLCFSLWRKRSPDDERQAFSSLNDAIFKLIANKRYVVASRVAEYALSLTSANVDDETRRMIIVNRASALRHNDDADGAAKVINQVDWSASSDLFKICRSAVLGNVDDVARLLPVLAKSEQLSAQAFKRWPCFAFVRDNDDIQTAFCDAFGMKIGEGKVETSTEVSSSANTLPTDSEVIH